MLYLSCTTITGVDLAHYGVSCAKDWVSVDCGTSKTEHGLSTYMVNNPLAKARGLSLHTGGQSCFIFHLYYINIPSLMTCMFH